MKRYILDTKRGILQEGKIEEASTNQCLILLTTLKEYEATEQKYPCKKELLDSLNYEKYCKVELCHECIQGIIHAPLIGEHRQKPFLFGFLLFEKELRLISDDEELVQMVEQLKDEVYEGFTLHNFLISLFNCLIERDMIFLQKIEESLECMEEKVLEGKEEHLNETILKNRRKLSQRHGYYVELMNVGDYMQSVLREISPDAANGWNLFAHRVERLHNYVELMKEYLLQIREMYQAQMDITQNRIVTFLTIITTICLPLTLVTGWYGMNFTHMPELKWTYGYLFVILASIIILLAEIWYCKKKKML